MNNKFFENLMGLQKLITCMAGLEKDVLYAAQEMSGAIKNGGKILVIGNGGSAAEALHFSGELLGRFKEERKGLPCIALVADVATITAVGNDYGYDAIFERQLEGLFNPEKDILLTLSTSGNSDNIIRAVQYAEEVGGSCINLIGRDGGMVAFESKNSRNIIVPSEDTPRIQEMHLFILHFMAEVIEKELLHEKR